ncbi:hypothetical protein AOL_s00076g256 [Orbilia oligospora ATCC 24927]|uniref:Uncharacterized protein n=1 Tax=Arthrobotrys oligospora (strain ATCC 24927 / CBS 115.81 / DSM 1491) TaxID=756982 RepID=G1X9E9_ARTOA|nr:hypothetical protein AOL_s00076g256 [Orbilia oligospora ATCC 24927]EGX50181.1 hypothetical protein AOL_s00076g256 [Orbilia oligospora ATCC 24927]
MNEPSGNPSHDSYTVACICPMGVELAAVEAMLDHIHEGPFSNKNSYTLGRMGVHNIVIAVMPEIGNNTAATVATQLLNDFKSIRFGLLVGIGGGIPVEDEYDIRLGDVVVSKSTGTFGGVVQFDRGKILSGGNFERTGSLNKPPAVIAANVEKLQARHRREGNKLSTHLADMLVRYPHMKEEGEYFYQGSEHDRLFEATYNHQGGKTCRLCDQSKVIDREPRRNTSPRIYYGNIGSSNQVLKDAITRDKLQEDLGIICVEMEAAGLMDQFPCLVIRGICDYADSHKNKRWQSYAAATAAAYAKELLSIIPAQEIDAAKQAIEALQISREQDRLLDILLYAKNAAYNSRLWEHSDRCLPDTRVELRKQIREWSEEPSSPPIFWLNGMAGTGKSTIARAIAEEFENKGQLAASFFFSRGGGNLSHAGEFVTTIAVQLANRSKLLKNYICEAVEADRSITSQNLRTQWKQLVLLPVSKLNQNTSRPFLFMVDALDECNGDDDITLLLHLFTGMEGIRVFITSRPETPIRLGFRNMKEIYHRDLALHEISRSIVDQDISTFFRDRFGKIIENSELLPPDWPWEDKITTLVRNAGGLFIYAATICRFIGTQSNQWPPQGLLEVFLPRDQNESGSKLGHSIPSASPTKELDAIYGQILYHSLKGTQEDEDKKTLAARFRQVVGTIVILSEPLSAVALAELLGVNQDVIHWSLRHLHSVLNVPKDQDSDIRLLHPSFRDFLLDEKRCHDPQFWIDKKMAHQQLAACCLKRLSCSHSGLKLDICNLKHPGTSMEEIDPSLATKTIPPEMQYACQYYAQHLQFSEEYQCDGSPVDIFLRRHFLHWLEALSLIGKTSQAVHAIALLKSRVDIIRGPDLSDFLKDAHQFILYNLSMIKQSPLQVYCSALIFTDQRSLIRKKFTDEMQRWVKSAVTICKPTRLIQVLQSDDTGYLIPLASSPNGKMIASASASESFHKTTIILQDAITGAGLQKFDISAHSPSLKVVFSADSKKLVSVSSKMIWVHNVATGMVVLGREFYESLTENQKVAMGSVDYVFISPDSKMVAALSNNRDLHLYDTQTGSFLLTLERYSSTDESVAYPIEISTSSRMVASGLRCSEYSCLGIVLWDIVKGTILRVLRPKGASTCALAFSPNGKKLASAVGCEVQLWDTVTGAILRAETQSDAKIRTLSFSPNGKTVGIGGHGIQLWDTEVNTLLQVNGENRGRATYLSFSPDSKVLVSVIEDEPKVWFWDIAAIDDAVPQEIEVHTSGVKLVVVSPDGTMIASMGYRNETVWLWDAKTGTALHIHQCEPGVVKAIRFSPDNRAMVYGTRSGLCVVLAWSLVTGTSTSTFQVLWKAQGHKEPIKSIAFSPNNKMAASASEDGTIRLWDGATGAALQTFKGHESWAYIQATENTSGQYTGFDCVAFSPDSKTVVSGSRDGTIELWDIATGACLQIPVEADAEYFRAVTVSPDSRMIVSMMCISSEAVLKIWDRKTGTSSQIVCEPWYLDWFYSQPHNFRLDFTADSQHLETSVGLLEIQLSPDENSKLGPELQPLNEILIDADEVWIGNDGKFYIIIPSHYEISCFDFDFRHNILAMGNKSGDLTFIEFN